MTKCMLPRVLLTALWIMGVACSTSTGGASGTGGNESGGSGGSQSGGSGGMTGAGGGASTGGTIGSGGNVSTGGEMGTGGKLSTGGATGSGGNVSTGGATGTGGQVSTGGVSGSGGRTGGRRGQWRGRLGSAGSSGLGAPARTNMGPCGPVRDGEYPVRRGVQHGQGSSQRLQGAPVPGQERGDEQRLQGQSAGGHRGWHDRRDDPGYRDHRRRLRRFGVPRCVLRHGDVHLLRLVRPVGKGQRSQTVTGRGVRAWTGLRGARDPLADGRRPQGVLALFSQPSELAVRFGALGLRIPEQQDLRHGHGQQRHSGRLHEPPTALTLETDAA